MVTLAAGNDYVPKTAQGSNLRAQMERYMAMRRLPRWQRRALVVQDTAREVIAFDAEFLLHFLLDLPAGASQVAQGRAINALLPPAGGAQSGADEAPAARHGTCNLLDRCAVDCVPAALQLEQLADNVTDPRILAVLDWAKSHGVDAAGVASILRHVLTNYQARSKALVCAVAAS